MNRKQRIRESLARIEAVNLERDIARMRHAYDLGVMIRTTLGEDGRPFLDELHRVETEAAEEHGPGALAYLTEAHEMELRGFDGAGT